MDFSKNTTDKLVTDATANYHILLIIKTHWRSIKIQMVKTTTTPSVHIFYQLTDNISVYIKIYMTILHYIQQPLTDLVLYQIL